MARTLYRIKDWDALYETAETRKLENLRWVPVPNKHDGLGFRRLAQQRNRCELLAAWLLLVQVASKGRRGHRGVLARDSRPLDAEDLSLMTGFPAPLFEQALSFYSDQRQGWLSVETLGDTPATATSASEQSGGSLASPAQSPVVPADHPARPAESPAEGKEENGMEGRRGPDSAPLVVPFSLNVPEFLGPWEQWQAIRRAGKKPKTSWDQYFAKQLAWLEGFGLKIATEIVATSARNEWQGLFEPKNTKPNAHRTGSSRSTSHDGVYPGAGFSKG